MKFKREAGDVAHARKARRSPQLLLWPSIAELGKKEELIH